MLEVSVKENVLALKGTYEPEQLIELERDVVSQLRLLKGSVVLDLSLSAGSGSGLIAFLLSVVRYARKLNLSITIKDLNPGMIGLVQLSQLDGVLPVEN